VTRQALRCVQLKMMDALARVFPEGSELDTIFWSYDDWREAREKVLAAKAEKLAPCKVPHPKT